MHRKSLPRNIFLRRESYDSEEAPPNHDPGTYSKIPAPLAGNWDFVITGQKRFHISGCFSSPAGVRRESWRKPSSRRANSLRPRMSNKKRGPHEIDRFRGDVISGQKRFRLYEAGSLSEQGLLSRKGAILRLSDRLHAPWPGHRRPASGRSYPAGPWRRGYPQRNPTPCPHRRSR